MALAVAIVLGMALGWLIHRTTYNRQSHVLKQTIAKQNARLAQAQSEVSMLTDDYDEMQRQSQDQINALRDENRQIPSLNSNLEKSQLLVKQMMQRHEAKVRELANDNQKLTTKLAKLNEQEQTRNQLAAELDKRRRQNSQPENNQRDHHKTDTDAATDVGSSTNPRDKQQVSDIDSASHKSSTEHAEFKASKPALFAAAESDADPFDQVMEVGGELQRELDMTAERKSALTEKDKGLNTGQPDSRLPDTKEKDTTTNNIRLAESSARDKLNLSAVRLDADEHEHEDRDELDLSITDFPDLSQDAEDLDNLIALDDVGDFSDTQEPDSIDTFSQTEDLEALDNVDGTLEETSEHSSTNSAMEQQPAVTDDTLIHDHGADQSAANDSLQLDGSGDNSTLFGPVSQHDDLQQIFGIGPLTEKALNELGITSYSQLAELKQHEIQCIADALEIGPGRIERDNWVGNARRQLEDVLEQL
ncbi:MAG: hypothetical protein AB8B87_17885 [Granulosicoccus sp.]